jgi:hypothetical protein
MPADGLYRAVEVAAGSMKAALPAKRFGGSSDTWLVPGAKLVVRRALLFSERNDNTRFQLLAWLDAPAMVQGVLIADGAALAPEGRGGDGATGTLNFALTAEEASAAARILAIARQDRRAVAHALRASFAASHPSYALGNKVEIVLTIENPAGSPEVQLRRGGRNRGPRNDQFDFTVTRDGTTVPRVKAHNFGGMSALEPLRPGQRRELSASLDGWVQIDAPGHYVVECRYETELSPAGADPHDDAQRGAVWDEAFTGRVTFAVR